MTCDARSIFALSNHHLPVQRYVHPHKTVKVLLKSMTVFILTIKIIIKKELTRGFHDLSSALRNRHSAEKIYLWCIRYVPMTR